MRLRTRFINPTHLLFNLSLLAAAHAAPAAQAAQRAQAAQVAQAIPDAPPRPNLAVRFSAPARAFEEAAPTGNGRLGATMYGGIEDERIDLNESSMWSGSRHNSDRAGAASNLPEIRRLLLAGDNVAAEALVNKTFTSADAGSSDPRYGCYQELGQLLLTFHGNGFNDGSASSGGNGKGSNGGSPGSNGTPRKAAATPRVTSYQRMLDLDNAVASTSFTLRGVHYRREVFTSAPDQVIVVHLTADKPASLSLRVALRRAERFKTSTSGTDSLLMTGELDSGAPGLPGVGSATGVVSATGVGSAPGVAPAAGVRYAADVKVIANGGTVSASAPDALEVNRASDVVLLITAATNYRGFAGRQTSDPRQAAAADLRSAEARPFATLLLRHRADYQGYFHRVTLDFGKAGRGPGPGTAAAQDQRTTVGRLAAAHSGADDPGLAALYFNFGRYLLISSSRPGGLPANLQGLWAEGTHTPWNGDWHLDVNIQMNYWPAEPVALGDLTGPLFALIQSLQQPGAQTARAFYDAPGWVAHVITNPWGYTSPGEQASWGATTIGSAWLSQHIWSHWLYSGDLEFLRRMYPVLRGASRFYLAMLVKEPKHHWLVTAPSNSPESTFYLPNGAKASVTMGPAIDEENLRYLFHATAQAALRLGLDPALQAQLNSSARQLAPIQISADGRILEWLEPYREVEPHHRHVSHLWALYPGDEIDPDTSPALAEAARKTLEARGDGGTGWSLAYKMLLWTRLGDGDHAYQLLRNLWKPIDPVHPADAGSLPNLFDVCPPFQIDGNFGATAAIAEMLLDSRPGTIHLLPALPAALPEGHVEGLEAMGGVTIGMVWHEGKLDVATLRAARATSFTLRYGTIARSLKLKPGQQLKLDAALLPL